MHRSRGVPDAVSWATLADLGRAAANHRRLHGRCGLGEPGWLVRHFRGELYTLGRLQFELARLYFDGTPLERGTPVLGIHIPDGAPLDPGACDASFATAREFFPRHFPETPYGVAVCTSWLLDPQLAEYLPADSNIVRFQRRFVLSEHGRGGDADVFRFVFRRASVSLDDVPQRTTLERAVVAHLRAGRHWHNRSGWLEL